jgi:hypothetical protein
MRKDHSARPNDLSRELTIIKARRAPIRCNNIVRNHCTAYDMEPVITESAYAAVGFVQDEIIVNFGCDASAAYVARGNIVGEFVLFGWVRSSERESKAADTARV